MGMMFWCPSLSSTQPGKAAVLDQEGVFGEMTAFTLVFLWHVFAFLNVLLSLCVVVEEST